MVQERSKNKNPLWALLCEGQHSRFGAKPELDSTPMTTDEVDNCRRRAFAYGATRGQLGFDQQRLHDMVSGCAYRQELLRTDLSAGEMQILQGTMGRERLDLWI
jgi:hypothetical protein